MTPVLDIALYKCFFVNNEACTLVTVLTDCSYIVPLNRRI